MTLTKPPTDDQLDAMLGRFLHAEAEVVGTRAQGERITTEALRRRVGRAPARRSWILLAAALLLTSAAALGLTVGAATLRDQADTPLPSGVPSALRATAPCELSLPGTWVVYGQWQDQRGRHTELVVHEDGSVISRVDPSEWQQGPLTIRNLTPAGVELVRAAVADGVQGEGCATVRMPGARPHAVVARSGLTSAQGGSAADFRTTSGLAWGAPYEAPLLAAKAEDQRIAAGLGERIEDLNAWLPADAWIDPVDRPYDGHWLIDIQQRYRGPESTEPAGPDPTGTDLVADPVVFPWYGRQVLGTPDGPPSAAMSVAPERCQVSDAGQAGEIRAELERSGALPPTEASPGWRYTVPGEPAYDVVVQLVALRPGELSCLDYSKAPEAPDATPAPVIPSTPETPRTDLTRVCSWLDLPWPRPATPRTLWHEACRR